MGLLYRYQVNMSRLLFGLVVWCCSIMIASCERNNTDNKEELTFKSEVGRYLFFDKRLSVTGTKSCAGCHDPVLAFTDGYRTPPGVYADLHFRNTPSLVNISSQNHFNWANPEITSLKVQMNSPLFGKRPVEMGLDSNNIQTLKILEKDSLYQTMFRKAFPEESDPFTWNNIKESLSAFVLSINNYSAPYDRYKQGDSTALSVSAKAGEKLFFSANYQCGSCHRPPVFGADSTMSVSDLYVNIGLYNYTEIINPEDDMGLFHSTGVETDRGKFKIPSLRNLSLTAPYFHDGSARTLDEVLEVYRQGGRNITYGKKRGDGRKDPNKHPMINGIQMSGEEQQNLLDFLYSLNDFGITSRTDFQSPFKTNAQTYVQ